MIVQMSASKTKLSKKREEFTVSIYLIALEMQAYISAVFFKPASLLSSGRILFAIVNQGRLTQNPTNLCFPLNCQCNRDLSNNNVNVLLLLCLF